MNTPRLGIHGVHQIMFDDINTNNSKPIIIHSSYNLTLDKLIKEIKTSNKLGAKYIIVHMKQNKNIYPDLVVAHLKTANCKIKILIENHAKIDIKELSDIYISLKSHPDKKLSNRFGICIDTCHSFVYGYSINKNFINMLISYFNDDILVVHLNNAKHPKSSKKDIHDNIEYGHIPYKNLLNFAKYMYVQKNAFIILETPAKHIYDDYNIVDTFINK